MNIETPYTQITIILGTKSDVDDPKATGYLGGYDELSAANRMSLHSRVIQNVRLFSEQTSYILILLLLKNICL